MPLIYHEGYSLGDGIEQVYADNGVLGAKNLLPNTGTSQTINGITFTVNDDGSVTANGTATAQAIFWVTGSNNNKYTFDKDVIISGCPSGGSRSTYALGGNNVGIVTDEAVITAGNAISVACVIYSGVTVSNLVFKPMLRLASDPDDTYVPYAMTNRELTDNVSPIEITDNWLTLPTDITKGDQYTVFKIGKLIIVNIVLCRNAGFDGTEFAIPINSQYQPIKQINANAIFQPTQYITEGSVGYLYVADKLIIRNMQSTPVNFCKINIAYICK